MGIQNNIKLSLPLTGHTAHNALPGLVTPDRLQGNHRVFHDPGINPEQDLLHFAKSSSWHPEGSVLDFARPENNHHYLFTHDRMARVAPGHFEAATASERQSVSESNLVISAQLGDLSRRSLSDPHSARTFAMVINECDRILSELEDLERQLIKTFGSLDTKQPAVRNFVQNLKLCYELCLRISKTAQVPADQDGDGMSLIEKFYSIQHVYNSIMYVAAENGDALGSVSALCEEYEAGRLDSDGMPEKLFSDLLDQLLSKYLSYAEGTCDLADNRIENLKRETARVIHFFHYNPNALSFMPVELQRRLELVYLDMHFALYELQAVNFDKATRFRGLHALRNNSAVLASPKHLSRWINAYLDEFHREDTAATSQSSFQLAAQTRDYGKQVSYFRNAVLGKLRFDVNEAEPGTLAATMLSLYRPIDQDGFTAEDTEAVNQALKRIIE
jgi:hypothetical protein